MPVVAANPWRGLLRGGAGAQLSARDGAGYKASNPAQTKSRAAWGICWMSFCVGITFTSPRWPERSRAIVVVDFVPIMIYLLCINPNHRRLEIAHDHAVMVNPGPVNEYL